MVQTLAELRLKKMQKRLTNPKVRVAKAPPVSKTPAQPVSTKKKKKKKTKAAYLDARQVAILQARMAQETSGRAVRLIDKEKAVLGSHIGLEKAQISRWMKQQTVMGRRFEETDDADILALLITVKEEAKGFKRKTLKKLTPSQKRSLMAEFAKSQFVDAGKCAKLAKKLNLEHTRVMNWFRKQRKRTREEKEVKEEEEEKEEESDVDEMND